MNIKLENIKQTDKYLNASKISQDKILEVLNQAKDKIESYMSDFTEWFPGASSINNVYQSTENTDWTEGFYSGMLWLLYEFSKEDQFLELAKHKIISFKKRIEEKIGTDTHDLGFLYSLSCVSAYKITGNIAARDAALQASRELMKRYKSKGEFIQAWGSLTDTNNNRLIIDCLLNLPLLYWASEITGDSIFSDIAVKHLNTAIATVIREDASTFHTFFFDTDTGEKKEGKTHQGYDDNSCWSRGQAWGIYGIALSYKYTKDVRLIGLYKRLTNYFINRLPEDYIAYWDLIFINGAEPRDSSAAAIAVCGMLEMDKWLDSGDEMKNIYSGCVNHIMNSLIEHYTTYDMPESNGLLLHSVYHKPNNIGVDECTIWGDYFFLEALVRMRIDWEMYW